MQIKKENIVLLPLTKIKPYKKNAKKHPKEQVERIANSIKRFGFTIPILVDGNNIVIAGHGRCLAAKMLGIKEVPCLVKETWTEEEVKAYRLIDNKVNESTWDEVLLRNEIEELEIDMEEFGFDFSIENENEESKYTMKTNVPHYEIKGEMPDISELVDDSKTKELLIDIKLSNAPEEVKKFLRLASYRHLKFNYSKIAEFYANSEKEVQELMEETALVIIDIDDAIANGYTLLSKQIDFLRGVDDET